MASLERQTMQAKQMLLDCWQKLGTCVVLLLGCAGKRWTNVLYCALNSWCNSMNVVLKGPWGLDSQCQKNRQQFSLYKQAH
jgi:hypothetical protein